MNILQKLEIRIKDRDWNAYGSSFAAALKANDTLTHVTVCIDGSDTNVESAAQHLVTQTLASHATLKSVGIFLRGVVQDTENDTILPNMLQTNTILQELQIGGILELPEDIVRFFLKINRVGRHQLLQCPGSHSLWTNAIVQQRHDVAFTHYLLSLNPTLCPNPIASSGFVKEIEV